MAAPQTSSPSAAASAAARASRFGAIAVVLGALVFAAIPLIAPTYQVSIFTEILIFAVLAMAVDILAGYTGRTPLCHGAIFGVATYVSIYWNTNMGGDLVLSLAAGVVAATFVAAIFALLAIRTSGVYFLLLTLALGMIVWGVCLRWTGVTGGENGLRGAMRPAALADHVTFYYVVFAVVMVVAFAMWRFVRSSFGLTLRGIRDSESRMRALGYNVSLHLFMAFTISGFFAGVAGALYAMFNEFASPSTVALSQSVEGLLMAVAGGVGTLFGGFLGSAVVIGLENFASLYTERWQSVLGLMFVLTMIFAPEGILGRIHDALSRSGK